MIGSCLSVIVGWITAVSCQIVVRLFRVLNDDDDEDDDARIIARRMRILDFIIYLITRSCSPPNSAVPLLRSYS